MFTFTFDSEYDSVTLLFKNEVLEISCCPENLADLGEDGYDSAPSNGEFSFYYDAEKITFSVAKHGDGQGGGIDITLKMTKEIRESLETALNEWRAVIKKREEEEEEEEEEE